MKKIFLFHLLLVCPVIFLIWYIVFPNYLWLLEGNAYCVAFSRLYHRPFDAQ